MAGVGETGSSSFERAVLGRTGVEVGCLGLAVDYGAPGTVLQWVLERGVDYIFWGSRRRDPFSATLKRLRAQRERLVLVIQS